MHSQRYNPSARSTPARVSSRVSGRWPLHRHRRPRVGVGAARHWAARLLRRRLLIALIAGLYQKILAALVINNHGLLVGLHDGHVVIIEPAGMGARDGGCGSQKQRDERAQEKRRTRRSLHYAPRRVQSERRLRCVHHTCDRAVVHVIFHLPDTLDERVATRADGMDS